MRNCLAKRISRRADKKLESLLLNSGCGNFVWCIKRKEVKFLYQIAYIKTK